jgi:uncharacterized protein YndB with AHSA1/START domain
MTIIRRTQLIGRPVADVFDVVVDGGHFSEWNPTIRRSRRLDDGPIEDGSTFEWDLRGFGKIVQELQEFDRDKRVRIVPHHKSLEGGHRFVFRSEGPGTTRVDHELQMNAKGAFRVFTPMMGLIGRKNLHDTAAALERHLNRGPVPD